MKFIPLIFISLALLGCSSDVVFDGNVLYGKLGGKPWKATHVSGQVFDFGTHKKEGKSIYSEPCEGYSCISLKSASIVIDNLDLSNEEGKFTLDNNITIYSPPSSNIIITKGSYKVSRQNGKIKLELVFKYDENNYLNGYIVY